MLRWSGMKSARDLAPPWAFVPVALSAGTIVVACASNAASAPTATPADGSTPTFTDGGVLDSGGDSCSELSRPVYVIDARAYLHSFDPPSATFTTIGQIDCGVGSDQPYSMS